MTMAWGEFVFDEPRVITRLDDFVITMRMFDFNGDGKMGLVATLDQSEQVMLIEAASNGSTYVTQMLPAMPERPMEAYPADFDGDGLGDILVTYPGANKVRWFRNTGQMQFTAYTLPSTPKNPWATGAGDVDGDGLMDPIVGCHNGSLLWYARTNQAPYFTPRVVSVGAMASYQVAAADLDGDGDIDLTSANYGSSRFVFYDNKKGDGSFFEEHVIDDLPRVLKVEALDLGGDGDQDLFIYDMTSLSLSWFSNDGASWPNFRRHVLLHGGWYFALGDLDEDHDPDFVGGKYNLYALENNGALVPEFIERPFGGTLGEIGYIKIADMDNDSINDVIVARNNPYDKEIIWYRNLTKIPNVEIFSPNGREIIQGGSEIDVHWRTYVPLAGTAVHMELLQDSVPVCDLGSAWAFDGEDITKVYLPLSLPRSDYRIRVTSTWAPQFFDVSDGTFTIKGMAIRLTNPAPGAVWTVNSRQSIQWDANTALAGTSVRFELWSMQGKVLDLGTDWESSGAGVLKLDVPNVPTGNRYQIRAISTWDPSIWGVTSEWFTIMNPDIPAIQSEVESTWTLYE